jgi:hypothetical protein
VLIRRKFYRQFPIFVCYVSWIAVKGAVLIGMNYAPFITGNEYASAFTVGAAIDTAIRFAVIYEIFWHLLRGYPTVRESATALFRWGILILLVIVIGLAWLAPAGGAGRLMSAFFVLHRTADVLLGGLLLLLFAFSGSLGLSLRSHAFGITLGLGILACVSLAASAIRSQIEPITRNQTVEVIELIFQTTYLCSVFVWMGYLFMPERGLENVVRTLPEHDLETWNQELERLLHQ